MSCPAAPESVGLLRCATAAYAAAGGVSGEKLDAIRLAVSEAASNAIIHGYRGAAGHVHLIARLVEGELWVLIADDGCGCQVPAARPGLGMGLALITDACEQFTLLERADGGTEAQMRFQAGKVAGGHSRGSLASASCPAAPVFSTIR